MDQGVQFQEKIRREQQGQVAGSAGKNERQGRGDPGQRVVAVPPGNGEDQQDPDPPGQAFAHIEGAPGEHAAQAHHAGPEQLEAVMVDKFDSRVHVEPGGDIPGGHGRDDRQILEVVEDAQPFAQPGEDHRQDQAAEQLGPDL